MTTKICHNESNKNARECGMLCEYCAVCIFLHKIWFKEEQFTNIEQKTSVSAGTNVSKVCVECKGTRGGAQMGKSVESSFRFSM